MIRAFWKKVFWIGVVVVIALILSAWLGALTSDAADLKCVTIKFKNDSELKLKTQWFVNHCDTNVVIDTVREHGYWWEHGDTDTWSFIPNDTCETYEIYYFPKRYITCRTLLFPPDVRKEPTTRQRKDASGKPEYLVITEKIAEDDSSVSWKRLFVTARDTIPGEALLWYEETKP